MNNSQIRTEDWGYSFKGDSAIKSLICNLENQAVLESYREYTQKRDHASKLIFELFGQESNLFYVRRKGAGKEAGEEIWELTIATDQEDFKLPTRLQQLGKILSLRAVIHQTGYGGLKILSARFLQFESGYSDGYSTLFQLQLLPNYKYNIHIPQAALSRMATMPVCGDYLPTEEQLKAWQAFLKIEERIAKSRQFCVSFSGNIYHSTTRQITFENIDVATATLDGYHENSLDEEDFWQRVERAKNEDIKLYETIPKGKKSPKFRQIGTIIKFDSHSLIISIRLERELAEHIVAGHYQLPANGFLFFEDAGNIALVKRKKKALDDLMKGYCQNPFLGNFFFESSQARPVTKIIKLRPEDLLLSSANSGQKAAVEMVLASEDLALIQGPPGTGKTTVIAEICYQVALRGGRTLIASQANLAVDNALSRLIHNPVIRAVRKGNAEKVGEEGQPFLEDRVIDTWLKNTATDCENNLNQHLNNAKLLSQLLSQLPRFTTYLEAEEVFNKKYNLLQVSKANLESNCIIQTNKYNQTTQQLQELISLKTTLEQLLNQTRSVDWTDTKLSNLWTDILSYTSTDPSVRNFTVNVSLAVDIASELSIESPKCDFFGLADWLQNTVNFRLAEVQKSLTFADNTATAITEAESAANINKQNLEFLEQLKSNYKESLINQKSLEKKIENLQNRLSPISLAKSELDKWTYTAYTNINNTLNQCLQERKDFTVELILFPLELISLAIPNKQLAWQHLLDDFQIKVNELIQKYRQWDRVSSQIVELKSLLLQARHLLVNYSINEIDASQVTFSKELNPVSLLRKLKQTTQNSIADFEKSLGVLDRIVEWLLTIITKYKNLESLAKILRRYSRRYNAAVTLEAIKNITKDTIENNKPINSESVISQITKELIEGVNTSVSIWLNKLQIATVQEQQQSERHFNEQQQISANYQRQISESQQKLATSHSEAEFKLKKAITLLQELAKFPQLPQEIRDLSQKYLATPSTILTEIQHFTAKIRVWETQINQLDKLISSLDIFAVISNINHQLVSRISALESETKNYRQQLTKSETKLKEIIVQLQQQLDYILTERHWWQSTWQTIPDNLKPEIAATDLLDMQFLYRIKLMFNSWKQQLKREETYLHKYQHFIENWITKLRQPSERDSNDLRRIYLENANVVGITCVQAASYNFSQEFKSFDVVIIDEVSKCTPPELLIPALKGKKLVMVGDHRQLPPMLNTVTLEEVVKEIGSTKEELQFLEESLFKTQFKTADNSIKIMLNTQYRMHPNIMEAINQFYNGQLESGILEPDSKRAHNLAGEIIKPEHHLIWVKMPKGNEFQEQRQGTSFFNIQEINVIEFICQQFENNWHSRVANGEPRKEIAIITFYGAQLRKIDERIHYKRFPSLQIRTGTVDRFQGMERPIVIVSMVRNNRQGDVGFANKPERVNVAFSRAQELLIIIGCHELFTNKPGKVGSMYSEVSTIVRRHGGLIDVSRICG
jgi:hypothetical protein